MSSSHGVRPKLFRFAIAALLASSSLSCSKDSESPAVATIEVTVNRLDHSPAAGVMVYLADLQFDRITQTVTDRDGRCVMGAAAPADYYVSALDVVNIVWADDTVHVTAPKTAVTLTLVPSPTVSGVVHKSDGTPANNAVVRLRELGPHLGGFVTMGAPEALFSFTVLELGSYALSATSDGGDVGVDTLQVGAAGIGAHVLRLSPPGRLHGHVFLQGMVDHHGVTVVTAVLDDDASTDSSGAWELSRMPPGQWRLEFSKAGYAPSTITVELDTEGGDVQIPDVTLIPSIAFQVHRAVPSHPLRRGRSGAGR